MARSSLAVFGAFGLFVPVASAQQTFVNWESPHIHPIDLTPDYLDLRL
jgi:hypothetical protein